MSLYLNFYHEVQKQKLKRQRDPLKIGIMVLLFIAMGFIAYYLWNMEGMRSAKSELSKVQGEWSQLDPKQKAAITRGAELDANKKLAESLTHKVENRFYWAPLIERVMKIIPPDVQITGFQGSVSNVGQKKISIVLSGIASGADPRSTAEKLRTSIPEKLAPEYQNATATFGGGNGLDDGTDIQVHNQSVHTASFSIAITVVSPDIDEATKAAAEKTTRRSKS